MRAGKVHPTESVSTGAPIRVMVVDDSAVVRGLVTQWLTADGSVTVVASVPDGEAALQQMPATQPEVVVLDIEMPKMDGMTVLPKLLAIDPDLKVIMSSTLTLKNAEISLRALSLGAADYMTKPSSGREAAGRAEFRREMVEKVKALGAARRMRPRGAARPVARTDRETLIAARPEGGLYGKAPITMRVPAKDKPAVIAIGSSTGGPQALQQVVSAIDTKLEQPILITQHMPPTFTTILAEHLGRLAPCREARNGDLVQGGEILLAPGDNHMQVRRRGSEVVIELTQDPPENFCRPSVDPMLWSLAEAFEGRVLCVMLTGMGHDGLRGCQAIVERGGTVLAQDEPSSVVWGMPGAVATGGLCSAVLPLAEIGSVIVKLSHGGGL